jgi:hypothetical protein
MPYWLARFTRDAGWPKSGEDVLGPPVKFCRVRELGKLHGLLAKLTERLARPGSDRRELAMVAEAWMAWRAVARRARGEFWWSLARAGLESARGGTAGAGGCFIGTSRCTGGRGPANVRGRALQSAGAWTGVNWGCQPRSNTWNRCFCPRSNANWALIFVNLGKIAVKDLFPWLCFIVCVWTSHGFRLGTGSCNVTKSPESDSRVPRSNGAKTVPNEFGFSSNFSKACSRKFGTTLIFGLFSFEFWKTRNTSVLEKGFWNSEFWILNFS